MKILNLLSSALGMMLLAARADALTLYASTAAGAPGELYILDSATGAVLQDVGPLNDLNNVNYPITGLAFQPHSGALLGSTGNSAPGTAAMLVKINPATAQVLVIGPFNAGPVNTSGTPATMADLAFDSAGLLYGVGSIGGPTLYTINTSTGQATAVGSTGLTSTSGGGLAVSSAGVFYGTPTSSRFGTYNSSTGAYTNIANPAKPAGTGAYTALDFNGSVLYGLNTGPASPPPTHLVTIDPTTGTVTDLGSSLNSLDAIAFQPAPPGLPGDYNNNGTVDAGDYDVFRKTAGTTTVLPNDPIGGTIGPAQYTQWRSNFGKPPGSGLSVNAVPEPATLVLLFVGTLATCFHRRKQLRVANSLQASLPCACATGPRYVTHDHRAI
jgi:hypothetical protein